MSLVNTGMRICIRPTAGLPLWGMISRRIREARVAIRLLREARSVIADSLAGMGLER